MTKFVKGGKKVPFITGDDVVMLTMAIIYIVLVK